MVARAAGSKRAAPRLKDGIWILADVKVMVRGSAGERRRRAETLRRLPCPRPDHWIAIRDRHFRPRRRSIYDLPDYIEQA